MRSGTESVRRIRQSPNKTKASGQRAPPTTSNCASVQRRAPVPCDSQVPPRRVGRDTGDVGDECIRRPRHAPRAADASSVGTADAAHPSGGESGTGTAAAALGYYVESWFQHLDKLDENATNSSMTLIGVLTGEGIDEVFKEVDVDKTGTISFEQFKKAMNVHMPPPLASDSVVSRASAVHTTCRLAPPAQSASTPKALLVRSRIHRAHAACRRLGGLRARDTHEDGGSSRGALRYLRTGPLPWPELDGIFRAWNVIGCHGGVPRRGARAHTCSSLSDWWVTP